MTVLNPERKVTTTRGAQVLTLGVLAGAVVGLVASYLYSRALEEERSAGNEVQPLQVGQIIAIALALLGVVRQVAEMGRSSKRRR